MDACSGGGSDDVAVYDTKKSGEDGGFSDTNRAQSDLWAHLGTKKLVLLVMGVHSLAWKAYSYLNSWGSPTCKPGASGKKGPRAVIHKAFSGRLPPSLCT